MTLDGSRIAPVVTWGTSPEDALPIDASVPDPARETNDDRAKYLRDALDNMGISAGKKLTDIAIDRVFIGPGQLPHRGLARSGGGPRRS